jgi:hypothetical protein
MIGYGLALCATWVALVITHIRLWNLERRAARLKFGNEGRVYHV